MNDFKGLTGKQGKEDMVTQSKFILIDKDTGIRNEHERLMYVEKKEKKGK